MNQNTPQIQDRELILLFLVVEAGVPGNPSKATFRQG
jgi:hypothetical protein